MRKLYYYSESKQKLKQFEYLKPKSILIYVTILIFLLVISWLSINLIVSFSSSSKSISALEKENKELYSKIKALSELYDGMDKQLEELKSENNYLRLAANLPPLHDDESALGVGGSEFESIFRSKDVISDNLDELSNYIESITLKLTFSKFEHEKISEKLRENNVLYASIPAIKPCAGQLGLNGFGMREHPILGINKMHEGIDIITDVGTQVHCSGNGVVEFVGYRGGYGLTIEVSHSGGYKTIYAHLSKVLVTEGQKIPRGKVIALTGNTGLSTGPHLHYEVHHDGIKLDPSQFFFDDLALFEPKNKK